MQGSNIRSSRPRVLIIVIIALVVVLAGAAGFSFGSLKNLKTTQIPPPKKPERVVDKVGALYMLPTDEQPTVAQVQDKEKLKDQTFFTKAENDDYILIFSKAKLAMLYREKDNKLVNVGPITLSDGETAGTQKTN